VARLREEFGAAVLIVHHTGWDGARERGHSAQRGAADTVMLLERAHKDDSLTRDPVRLRCLKQKDAAEFEDIDVIAQPVPLGNDPDGKPQSSFVLTLTGADRPLSTEENDMTTKEQEYRTTIEDTLGFVCEGPVGPEELRRLRASARSGTARGRRSVKSSPGFGRARGTRRPPATRRCSSSDS